MAYMNYQTRSPVQWYKEDLGTVSEYALEMERRILSLNRKRTPEFHQYRRSSLVQMRIFLQWLNELVCEVLMLDRTDFERIDLIYSDSLCNSALILIYRIAQLTYYTDDPDDQYRYVSLCLMTNGDVRYWLGRDDPVPKYLQYRWLWLSNYHTLNHDQIFTMIGNLHRRLHQEETLKLILTFQ